MSVLLKVKDEASPAMDRFSGSLDRARGAQAAFGREIGGAVNQVRRFEQGIGMAVSAIMGPVALVGSVIAAGASTGSCR